MSVKQEAMDHAVNNFKRPFRYEDELHLTNLKQPGVRPGMTPVLAQQLARPPNPAASGGAPMTPQAAGGSQQMMQGGPRTQEVIWEGELQWKENVKAADGTAAPSGNKTVHTVRCQAKASKASRVVQLNDLSSTTLQVSNSIMVSPLDYRRRCINRVIQSSEVAS